MTKFKEILLLTIILMFSVLIDFLMFYAILLYFDVFLSEIFPSLSFLKSFNILDILKLWTGVILIKGYFASTK